MLVVAETEVTVDKSTENGGKKPINDDENKDSGEARVETDFSKMNLIYGVMETPPLHVTIVCALQQGLLSLSGHLIVSLLVAEAVCAADDDIFKARLLSSTLFMSGITTLAMNLIGIRVPPRSMLYLCYWFPALTAHFVLALWKLQTSRRMYFLRNMYQKVEILNNNSVKDVVVESGNDTLTSNFTEDQKMDRILTNVRSLQGGLMLAGFVHAMLGFTGLVGLLLRFIGPLTIVPTMTLLFIFLARPAMSLVEVNWPIALSTIAIAVILCLYLSKYSMPIPVWTPSEGCRVIRYPLHQIFAVLISILANWALCGILTAAGVFTDDPKNIGYKARTDARTDVIMQNPWFTFPYPGQFGPISFNGSAFVSCMVATLISILDSVGDYYACARVCRVPAPPSHAVNRGIFVEGVCSFFSGFVGCGHATSTNGGNIGAVGVTKVASRRVFFFTGILYILFGIFGKFSALFITMPYPVLGGALVVLFGIFFGVIISNLEVTNMSSPRNIAILGLSTFLGLMVPAWVQKVKTPFHTGNEGFDKIGAMLLGNPTLVGTILAIFLDNTVSGTPEERGIAAWQVGDEDSSKLDPDQYNEGYEVYSPLIPQRLLRHRVVRYIPFLPYRGGDAEQTKSNKC